MKIAEDMYKEISAFIDDELYETKIEKLEALLQIYPDFAPAHAELGVIYYQLKNHSKALTYLEKAVEIEPNDKLFQKNLGDFYYTVLARSEDALDCYHKVLDQDPEDIQINFITANVLLSLHRFDEAENLYQKVLSMEPWRSDIPEILEKLKQGQQKEILQNSKVLHQKAQAQVQNGDTSAAIETLTEIIRANPRDALAQNDMGVLTYHSGDIEKAIQYYKAAVSLEPENITFKKNLAEYYLIVKQDVKEALKLYLSILEGHPYDMETLWVAAKLSEKFNQIPNAIIFYKAILDIEPWNLEASEKISELEVYQTLANDDPPLSNDKLPTDRPH